MITETARINKREQDNAIFPYSSYNVCILSNDHTPPHFHVKCDGWDIAFTIDEGELHRLISRGNDLKQYDYVVNNAPKWLLQPFALFPQMTNQENAMVVWEELHDV